MPWLAPRQSIKSSEKPLRSTDSSCITRSTAPASRWSCCTAASARAKCSTRSCRCWPQNTRSSPSICRAMDARPISTVPCASRAWPKTLPALLKQLGISSADILGYSLGGGVALQTAIHHPELLRKLVLVSTPFKRQGFYPEVLENMGQMGPEAARFMDQAPVSQLYPGKDWAGALHQAGRPAPAGI